MALGRCASLAELGAARRYQQAIATAQNRLAELAQLRTLRRSRASMAPASPSSAISLRKAA
jgi:hypothetical protein